MGWNKWSYESLMVWMGSGAGLDVTGLGLGCGVVEQH